MSLPGPSPLSTPGSPNQTRSYARAPTVRPYQSAIGSRQGHGRGRQCPIQGDTKAFADMVVEIVVDRSRRARMGKLPEMLENVQQQGGGDVAAAGGGGTDNALRKGRSCGGSLSGSWEMEKAELLVDIPVWSPGCFQGQYRIVNGLKDLLMLGLDLSTLHALRDTTLSHTHSLLSYLMSNHSIPASYRLLARSATGPSAPSSPSGRRSPSPHRCSSVTTSVGWGCIRLAPSGSSPIQPKRELKPAVRRSSLVLPRISNVPTRSPLDEIPALRLDFENAIAEDDDDEDERKVSLKEGYRSERGSDDESEEESADLLIAKEVERRGAKEG